MNKSKKSLLKKLTGCRESNRSSNISRSKRNNNHGIAIIRLDGDDAQSTINVNITATTKQERFSNTTFHQVRYVMIVLGGFAIGSMLFTRLSITVAMLAMVNHTQLYLSEHPNSTVEDFFPPDYVEVGQFNWNNEIQQTIIGGYMIAYTLPQVTTTKLSVKYGIRKSISLCLLICSLSCLLTPIFAYWGWEWILALRLLNGLGASSMIPSIIGAIDNWIPKEDSAMGLSLLQFVQTSIYVVTPLVSGEFASIHWEWAFYGPGIFTAVFALIWWLVVRDAPESCPFISQQELDIIKGNHNQMNTTKTKSLQSGIDEESGVDAHGADRKSSRRQGDDFPWYFMFRIRSFYLFIPIWILYCCTFGGFTSLLPSYFHKILQISVNENGFYNFIIQLGVMYSMLWPNPIISFLRKHHNMSLSDARRTVVFIYSLMTIATFSYIAAYHENQILVLCINRFFHMTSDTIITSILMSQYGQEGLISIAYSVMNAFGYFSSLIFCWAVGKFLDFYGESRECWSLIFTTIAALNVMAFVLTILLKSEPIKLKA